MVLLDSFKTVISKQRLFSEKDHLLLAVSGGIDSVVLCELCHQAGYSFTIAHCNFQLRGNESERDENFVRQLGLKYNAPVLVKRFDTDAFAAENKLSVQEAARTLRYTWFEDIIKGEYKDQGPVPKYLLTAHHADDNVETLLMNFFRGTGLHGLTGIPVAPGYIRRPLLSFPKAVLSRFTSENDLEFVEDSSNQSSKYTRNFFRNEIIPLIEKSYPKVKDNLLDNIQRFGEIERLYKLSVGHLLNKLVKKKGEELHIPIKQLLRFDNRALIFELVSPYGFVEKQVGEIIKLRESESGRYILSPTGEYRIIKHRHWFILSPAGSTGVDNYVIDKGTSSLDFGQGRLQLRTEKREGLTISSSHLIAQLDAGDIQFPLLLRKWKTGDYFYPLGMKKKKKVSRFFIDQKLSKTDKENAWVIEMNKKIIWVVGHRIDDRFRITEQTTEVLAISVEYYKI